MTRRALTLTCLVLIAIVGLHSGCNTTPPNKSRPINNVAEAYRNQALDHFSDRRPDEGLDDLRQAILLDPDEAWPYQYVFTHCWLTERKDQAITIFQQAIEVKPDNALAYLFLGVAYRSLSRYEDAIGAYKQLVALNPDEADSHYELGSLYLVVGNKEEALKEYQSLIGLKEGSWPFSTDRRFFEKRAEQLLESIKTGNIVLSRGGGCIPD
jgi:tetratricopeptide (TPR) repeat protein